MKLHPALPGLLAVLATTGCLTIQTVDVGERLIHFEPSPSEEVEKLDHELVVYVVSSPSMGGVIIRTADRQKAVELGWYTADLFPLDPDKDAEAQIRIRADELEGKGVLCGLKVDGFAETLSQRLRERLGERFKTVTVRRIDPMDAEQGIVVKARAESYMEVIPTFLKRSIVRLQADLDKRRTVFVKGKGSEHVSRGHLVWAIPATLVSATTGGIPGVIGIHFGIQSLEAEAMADSLVEGIDDAARKLAQKLAEKPDRPVPLNLDTAHP